MVRELVGGRLANGELADKLHGLSEKVEPQFVASGEVEYCSLEEVGSLGEVSL